MSKSLLWPSPSLAEFCQSISLKPNPNSATNPPPDSLTQMLLSS